jgi:hypothetical protein
LAVLQTEHWAHHKFGSIWHPLSQTKNWPLHLERMWVKFRRTKHHRFFFLFANSRLLLGAVKTLRVLGSSDPWTPCLTAHNPEPSRGAGPHFYTAVSLFSLPFRTISSWSEQ